MTRDLKGKSLWDLSLDDIEYVYRHLHMNNYVYAAAKTFYASSPPLQRPVTVRREATPHRLWEPVDRLLRLSPMIGVRDPSFVRVGVVFATYELYRCLGGVCLGDICQTAQLLAACAYMAIHAEKNDNKPIWNGPVVREKSRLLMAVMDRLLESPVDIEGIALMGGSAEPLGREAGGAGELSLLFRFVPRVMQSILVHMENGDDPQLIEQAIVNGERAMRLYEHKHGYSGEGFPGMMRYCGQIRYRNTMYLYGGMFFQRIAAIDRAIEWYLRDMECTELPTLLEFFLTGLKSVERLISGYCLLEDDRRRAKLRYLIDTCFRQSLLKAAEHSHRVRHYLETHPTTDVRNVLLGNGLLFGGEPSREVYLLALLYNRHILGVDYGEIDYARFFEY